jgi:hypothetical protein
MENRSSLFWPLAAWALFAGAALWLTRGELQLDTDSAMRLAEVRDLVAGQGWFDTMQHRLNTPYGLAMHWSRLVDTPLALLLLISERLALTAWPLLLFAALLLCDSYSLFYAVLLAAGGLGAAAISLLPRRRPLALGVLAVALMGLAALLNPACFAGPYGGLDARMKTLFLARINEAHPVWEFFRMSPSQTIGSFAYGVFALALCFALPPGRNRSVIIAFSAVALAVATLQYRATPFALVFVLPGLAAALVHLTARRSLVWLAAALLAINGAAFTLAAALAEGQARVAARATAFAHQVACGEEPAMAALRRLPRGRVAGFVDQGPAIMAYTQHSAIAGPYHRDSAGILDTYEIFAGKNPLAVLRRRGIDYVMTCRAAPDWNFYRAQGGLVTSLAKGEVPDWLLPVGTDGDVAVYRIKR